MTTLYLSGQSKGKLAIKAPRPAQCWVNGIDAVGCANDNNLASAVKSIHESQQCGHDGGMDLILLLAANRCKAINLIEEDDARLHTPSLQARRVWPQ